MMRKQNDQIQIVILNIDSIIPETHRLRQITTVLNFDFQYRIKRIAL